MVGGRGWAARRPPPPGLAASGLAVSGSAVSGPAWSGSSGVVPDNGVRSSRSRLRERRPVTIRGNFSATWITKPAMNTQAP